MIYTLQVSGTVERLDGNAFRWLPGAREDVKTRGCNLWGVSAKGDIREVRNCIHEANSPSSNRRWTAAVQSGSLRCLAASRYLAQLNRISHASQVALSGGFFGAAH